MKKHKNLTYEEHLENADDFAIIFHHFEKIFKTYTTMTPLKYRKSGHIFAPSELPINP